MWLVVISKATYLMFPVIAACLSRLVRDHRNLSCSPEGFPIRQAVRRRNDINVALLTALLTEIVVTPVFPWDERANKTKNLHI
jgi:hypothetical protein